MCLRIKVAELNTLSDGNINYLSENANFRKLADVKEALLSGTSQQALSVSLESLLTSDIHT